MYLVSFIKLIFNPLLLPLFVLDFSSVVLFELRISAGTLEKRSYFVKWLMRQNKILNLVYLIIFQEYGRVGLLRFCGLDPKIC